MKLKDICEINPRIQGIADYMSVSFVPMPCVSEDGKIDPSDIRQFLDVKKGYTVFQENDVLFAKITPCMENGKGAIARGLMNGIGCGSSEFHVFRANNEMVCPEWIYYLTAWSRFRREAEKHMTGSAGQRRVPKAYLENFDINVPSLPEQTKQIKVLSHLQQIIDCRKRELQKLDELVKARFVEMFGGQYPEDSLLHLCNIIDYRGKTPEKVDSGLPFITAKNVKMHYMAMEPREYISKETYDKVMVRGFPKEGDVVFTTEAPLGNVCRIPHFDTEFYIGQRIVTMQTEMLNPIYLEYALSDSSFVGKYMSKSSGSTVTGIRVRLLEQLTIPVPPRHLQDEFACFVDQLDKSKVAVQAALDKAQTLFDSLMQKYFG